MTNLTGILAGVGGYVAGHEVAFGDFSKFCIRFAEQGTPFVYNWPVPAARQPCGHRVPSLR